MKQLQDAFSDIAHIKQIGVQALLDLFIDEAALGPFVVDSQSRIVWIEDRYAAFLGINKIEDVIGKVVEEVLPNSRMREVVETGKPIMLDIFMAHDKPLVVMRIPLRGNEGEVIGAIAFALYDRLQGLKPLFSKFAELQSALNSSKKELAKLRQTKYSMSSFVGVSPAALELKIRARRAAQLDTTVLLLGETGSGKELLAHGIHSLSERASNPFIAVNIAAIPDTLLEAEFFGVAPGAYTGADRKGREGKFKIANGGTLFLDEVGDMSLQVQAKLLRVLQEQEIEPLGGNQVFKVDVRVIAATSRDLKGLMATGKFRSDLYYRLNVLPIALPALRERKSDVDALGEHLLEQISERTGQPQRELTPSARAVLAAYDWPGNVRELRNVLEQACMLTDRNFFAAEDFATILPATTLAAGKKNDSIAVRPLAQAVAELEKGLIESALKAGRGNKASAARQLGISRGKLYQKMLEFGIMSD